MATGQFKLARVWHAELAGISDIRQLVEEWQKKFEITERFQDLVNAYASIVVGDKDYFDDFFAREAKRDTYMGAEAKDFLRRANGPKQNLLKLDEVKDYFASQFNEIGASSVFDELNKTFVGAYNSECMSDLWRIYVAKHAGTFHFDSIWYQEKKLKGFNYSSQGKIPAFYDEYLVSLYSVSDAKRFQDLVNAYASIVAGDRDAFEDFFEDEADDESNREDRKLANGILSRADDQELLLGEVRGYFRQQFDQLFGLRYRNVLDELDSIIYVDGFDGGRPMSNLWAKYDEVYGAGRFNFDSIWYKKLEPYRKGFQAFYDGIIHKGLLQKIGDADRFEDLVNAYANIISGDQDAFEDFFEDEADLLNEGGDAGVAKDILSTAGVPLRVVREYFNAQLSNLTGVHLVQIEAYLPPLKFKEELMMSQIWRK